MRESIVRIERIKYGYFIDECHVTNKQYREFVEWVRKYDDHKFCHKDEPKNKDHAPYNDFSGKDAPDVKCGLQDDYFVNTQYDNYPVVNIDWWDAFAFARWSGKRLPSEKEWEKAARGIDGRLFPYGNKFDPSRSNVAETGIYKTTPVKKYISGRSPYGCYDMCGNVWDWCSNAFGYSSMLKDSTRVVRGGSCTRSKIKAYSSFRNGRHVNDRWISRGFRCVKDI